MDYLKNEERLRKFNKAFNERKLILITAATGFGKTRFLEEALQGREYAYFSLKENYDSLLSAEHIVVIDDFQFIVDKDYLMDDIVRLSKKCPHLIISSRSNPSSYFMEAIVARGYVQITESDLSFTKENLKCIFQPYLSEHQLQEILSNSMGCPLIMLYLKTKLEQGEPYSLELLAKSQEAYGDHIKLAVFDFIDQEVLHFLIQVSVVDSFDIESARAITMNDKAISLVSKAIAYGSFITKEDSVYYIRPAMLYCLRKKSYLYYSFQEYREFIYNAGHYFESVGEIEQALKLYEECESIVSIKRILVNNSTINPALGNFKALKKYYEMLDGEDIKRNPILISGMCMLYALLMDVEKSDYYYKMLVERFKQVKGAERNEIETSLEYLNVALPQRGSRDVLHILSTQGKHQVKAYELTPYALTSNCPSIINGGKDFTEYLPMYDKILSQYGDIMEQSMGKISSKGLLSTIKAECQFETGVDSLAVLHTIVKAKMETDKSQTDNLFVLSRLEVLLGLENGKIEDAFYVMNNIIEQSKNLKNKNLLQNIYAYRIWLCLLANQRDEVEKWVSQDPIERLEFYTSDRTVYLIKIRCYIYLGKYMDALELIQKLEYYAVQYERPYILSELYLLKSIIEYHIDQDFVPSLVQGLKIAEARKLIRMVSFLGITMDEMIHKNREKLVEQGISLSFLLELNPLLLNIATRYPKLYNKEDNSIPQLSKTGIMILQLQSQGYSLKSISSRLLMNLETIRYHAKQNYKKLGAAGSTDAVTIAKKFGLL